MFFEFDPAHKVGANELLNDNLSVTFPRTNSFTTQIGRPFVSSGTHTFIFYINEHGSNSSLYVGVATETWAGRTGSRMNGQEAWAYQADGYTYMNGNSSSGGPRIETGDIVATRSTWTQPQLRCRFERLARSPYKWCAQRSASHDQWLRLSVLRKAYMSSRSSRPSNRGARAVACRCDSCGG